MEAFDLSNYLVSGIVRPTYGSTGTILDLAPVTGSPASGHIDINLSGTNTTGLASTQGIYDIQVIDKSHQQNKAGRGLFNINPTIRFRKKNMVKIVSIADEAYRELASPSTCQLAISFWLRTNLGQLNNLIDTSYTLNADTQELDTGLTIEEAVIFKKLYFVHYYDLKIRATLGAASNDSVVEASSDGARVED